MRPPRGAGVTPPRPFPRPGLGQGAEVWLVCLRLERSCEAPAERCAAHARLPRPGPGIAPCVCRARGLPRPARGAARLQAAAEPRQKAAAEGLLQLLRLLALPLDLLSPNTHPTPNRLCFPTCPPSHLYCALQWGRLSRVRRRMIWTQALAHPFRVEEGFSPTAQPAKATWLQLPPQLPSLCLFRWGWEGHSSIV